MILKVSLIIALFVIGTVSVLAQGNSNLAPGRVKQAVVGPVDSISLDSVTVTDKKNKIKTQIAVDPSTLVVGRDKKAAKLGSVRIKDLVAVISSEDSTVAGKFKVQKIFVKTASESAQLNRRAVMGVITAIDGNTISLTHQVQTDRAFTVMITPQTIIRFKSNKPKPSSATPTAVLEASPSASQATLVVGQRIVAMGNVTPEGITAKLIHIIPGVATGVFKKLPTPAPSPTVSASPSASPTPTGTPSATLTPSPSPL